MFYYWFDELCFLTHFTVRKHTIEIWAEKELTIEQIAKYCGEVK